MKRVLISLLILALILSSCNAKTSVSSVEDSGERPSQQESSGIEFKQGAVQEDSSREESIAQIQADSKQEELDVTGDFLMPIEDIFSITGRGVVVTGRIMRGNISINDELEIIGMGGEVIVTKVTGIESFRKLLDSAEAGDNMGCSSMQQRRISQEDRSPQSPAPSTPIPNSKPRLQQSPADKRPFLSWKGFQGNSILEPPMSPA